MNTFYDIMHLPRQYIRHSSTVIQDEIHFSLKSNHRKNTAIYFLLEIE